MLICARYDTEVRRCGDLNGTVLPSVGVFVDGVVLLPTGGDTGLLLVIAVGTAVCC